MSKRNAYPGIEKDPHGAINPTGNIIRDAWLFGLLPETEGCAGWTEQAIDDLYEQVAKAWEKYDYQVSSLPPELREKHQRIFVAAVERARALGWNPPLDEDEQVSGHE